MGRIQLKLVKTFIKSKIGKAKDMPNNDDKTKDLLESLLLLQLYNLGISQGAIAKFMGKSKTWVNERLEGLPKKQ